MLTLDFFPTQDMDIDTGLNATSHATLVGKLDVAVVQLCKAGTVLDRDTPKLTVDGIIADYTGYADLPVAWSPATRTGTGGLMYEGVAAEFRPSGSAATNMIGAIALYNAAKTKLYGVANLPGLGLPMVDALSAFTATIQWEPSGKSRVIIEN